MTYDNYGNILTKNGKQYCYDNAAWPDLLTCYDGQTITYDAQGNPTEYLGNVLTWEKGRQLKSFCENTYTYNANGIRTSKTVGGVKHNYTLDGSKILKETWGDNVLVPLYDTEETVCGIIYNKQAFYFQKNLQGDIIGITNASGTAVARYNYDAWGVCTTAYDTSGCAIATVNPFRYRGYYYDPEIGMYYLQSRYYDPVVGRFINADHSTYVAIDDTVASCNLFVYCKNATVTAVDPSGCNSLVAAPQYYNNINQGYYEWASLLATVVPAVAAAKVAIIAAIKSVLAFLWNVFIVVGLVVAVILLAVAIEVTAAKIMTLVNAAVIENTYKNIKGYVVYVLTRKKDDPSTVFYVGRTKHFGRRMKAHEKDKYPCFGHVVVACRTLASSRAIEQAVLSACIISKVFKLDTARQNTGSNKIRGIAKESVRDFKGHLSELASLMTCTKESDLLNLMGS